MRTVWIGLLVALAARGGGPDAPATGAVIRVSGVEASVARFGVGEPVFSIRALTMARCPDCLKGRPFVRDNIEDDIFECAEAGELTVLTAAPENKNPSVRAISNAAELERRGFVRDKGVPPFDILPGVRACAYRKNLVAGEAFRFSDSHWVLLTGFRRADITSVPKAEIFDWAMRPPEVDLAPGARYQDEHRGMNMALGMDRTPGGRIWAAWISGADGEKGYLVAASSDDDGETWTKPRLAIDPADHSTGIRCRTLVGNLWTDPKGRLWLFFDQSIYYFDGRAGCWFTRCDNPDAASPAWTKPERIWHGCTLQKPTVLSTGEWLLPISLWRFPSPGRFEELDADRRAWLFASTDGGATWSKRGGVAFPRFNYDEHMAVELSDGRLWMTARTKEGIFESFSTDRGATWGKPKRSAIVNDATRHHVRKLKSGRILLVKNGPTWKDVGRRQMMAFLSADDGATWSAGLELEPRERSCSYPDGFQAGDGRIFILYDHERTGAKEILMARFTEADILAGKIVTPGSRLRMLVNKARGGPE